MKKIVSLIIAVVLLSACVFTACDADMGKVYVNFDTQDGSPVITKSQWVQLNKSIPVHEPDSPAREGYIFKGWYKEPECENKWDFENDTLKSGDTITLYAKFELSISATEETCTVCNEQICICPPLSSALGLGCADCNVIPPYEPRHNENKEEGVFWELPYLRAGVSTLPAIDINRQPIDWGQDDSTQLFVIDSYNALSLMRLGRTDSSRPIAHNYSEKYFENNALLFAKVGTSSMGHVPYVRFQTLVTDAEALYPVFKLDLPEGGGAWDCAIGSITFLIEIPRVLLEEYELGSIAWMNNSNITVRANEQTKEGQINRLPDAQKIDCDCLFGLRSGEDDSVLAEYNYVFQAEGENFRFAGNSGNDSHAVYIRYSDEEEFVFAAWAHVYPPNSIYWSNRLMDLPLKAGNNQLMIVSDTTRFVDGADERTFGYASVFVSDEVNTQPYEYSVSGTAGSQSFGWQSAGLHKVFVKRAGCEEYEPILNGSAVGGLLRPDWATRAVNIETFDFQLGINTVMIINYTYSNGIVTRNETKWDIERTADTAVDYNFRIGNVVVYGQSILWNGNGFYYPYIKRADESEFTRIMSWGVKSDSGIALSQINCSNGLNQIKLTQMQFSNGKVSLHVGLFSFNYTVADAGN